MNLWWFIYLSLSLSSSFLVEVSRVFLYQLIKSQAISASTDVQHSISILSMFILSQEKYISSWDVKSIFIDTLPSKMFRNFLFISFIKCIVKREIWNDKTVRSITFFFFFLQTFSINFLRRIKIARKGKVKYKFQRREKYCKKIT